MNFDRAAARNSMMDRLRGFAILLMILDHTRDFVSGGGYPAGDPTHAPLIVFLMRVASHVGAPIFVFLAGAGAAFVVSKRGERAAQRFLLERGLILILLEVTVLRLAWTFQWIPQITELQAIWVLGLSMIALAITLKANRKVGLACAVLAIFLHNAINDKAILDQLSSDLAQGLFRILHKPGLLFAIGEAQFHVLYPLIPWFPLMHLGYLWGSKLASGEAYSSRTYVKMGLCLWALFFVLRVSTSYSDPKPFLGFSGTYAETLTLFHVSKYPPSLSFLLLAMGGLFLLAAWFFKTKQGPWMERLEVFGRTSLFVYTLHLFVVHGIAVLLAWLHPNVKLQNFNLMYDPPAGYGYPLVVVYLVGAFTICFCYPICRWYDCLKSTSPAAWLRYL